MVEPNKCSYCDEENCLEEIEENDATDSYVGESDESSVKQRWLESTNQP